MRLGFLVFLSVLATTGCPSDPPCARNSDCAAGSYCSAGGCVTACTPETVVIDCGVGWACTTFGMCVAPPDAGGSVDGGPRDGGSDASFDGGAACVVAGGIDADGDGFCDDDCDDADADVSPAADEVCTTREAALEERAVDENCDGAIDEGCPWHFGALHPVTVVHTGSSIHEGGQLSEDGLRFYVRGFDSSGQFALTVSERASTSDPFGPATIVAIADLSGRAVGDLALSSDELELFVDDDRGAPPSNIYRATRATRSAPFGPLAEVAELNSATGRDYSPTLSRDGLEIFFTRQEGVRVILRATRSSITVPFSAPEPVTIPGATLGDAGVALSRDGRTLFVQRLGASGSRVYRAERASPDTAIFDTAVEVVEVGDSGLSYTAPTWIDERTREAFFGSTRPWAPASYGLFRAEICRDGPCVDQVIPCADGTRSPDLLHCYSLTSAPSTWGNAASSCLAGAEHLASIHSEAEQALIWSSFGAADQWRWIGLAEDASSGLWSWDGESADGALVIYTDWYPGEPQPARNEPYATMAPPDGHWADFEGSSMHHAVCERELWPTW